MLTSHDVGRRVSVRRRVERRSDRRRSATCSTCTDDRPRRAGPDGEVADPRHGRRHRGQGRAAGDPAPRVGGAPTSRPADMQRICWAGWPAREHERLGDWAAAGARRHHRPGQLGDGGGRPRDAARGRAGAVRPGGTPTAALPPLLQLPLADPANQRDGRRRLGPAARDRRAGRAGRGRARLARRARRPARRRRADAVGRLALADARPRRRRPGRARRDPHRPAGRRLRDALRRRRRAGRASAGSRSRASGPASPRSTWRRPPAGRASAPR